MNLRALTVLGISGMALAACSGGQSNVANSDLEVVSGSADISPQALLEVREAETGSWAMSRPPSGPATTFVARPTAGTTTIEPTATFERFKRAEANDASGTAALTSGERLTIKKDAVQYESGKTMFGPDGSGTIEELPLRAFAAKVNQPRGRITDDWGGGREYFHSIEVTQDGLVLKLGGTAGQYDQQRRFDIGDTVDKWYSLGADAVSGSSDDNCLSESTPNPACTNWNSDDTRVTFGRPMTATHGHHAWYWNTRIPLPEGQSATDRNLAAKFDFVYSTNRDLGSYELWISNLARIDRGAEDSRQSPSSQNGDDQPQYLDYAAYGLFLPTDELVSWQQPGRMIGFHFGYDAFADSDDERTTDISEVVTATFSGTTSAQMIHNLTGTIAVRPTRTYLRGDVTLSARIGGSGGGKISGEISGFEMLGPDGTWHPHAAIIDPKKNERLVLTGTSYKTRVSSGDYTTDAYDAQDAAAIGADGSYEGGVYLQSRGSNGRWATKSTPFTDYSAGSDASKFGGTFYGPTDNNLENIETAGYWFLTAQCAANNCGGTESNLLRYGSVYGSFGAERTDSN